MNSQLNEFTAEPMIAYFSMEIGVKNDIPTYSGGLGILAGDTIKSAADLNLPLVAVTLVTRKGYFEQEIDSTGWQREKPVQWDPAKYLKLQKEKVKVQIEGRDVSIQAWVYQVVSPTGGKVPILFLDTDLPENDPGTGSSPTPCTAATAPTGSSRRSCSAWAACACCRLSNSTSRNTT